MKKLKISDVIFRIFAWFWAIVTLYPLLVTVLCSFKDNNGIYGNMFAFPEKWEFANYKDALLSANIAAGNRKFIVACYFYNAFSCYCGNVGFLYFCKDEV